MNNRRNMGTKCAALSYERVFSELQRAARKNSSRICAHPQIGVVKGFRLLAGAVIGLSPICWHFIAAEPESAGIAEYRAAVPGKATLLFAGDTHFQWGIARLAEEPAASVFKEVQPWFARADFRILNLETTIVESGQPAAGRSHVFRASPEALKLLEPIKPQLLILANNHTMDMGAQGLTQTLSNLSSLGFLTAGAGSNQREAGAPVFFRVGDITFALLAASAIGDERMWATDRIPGVARPDAVLAQIRTARERADHVIVSMHWGIEYHPFPTAEQTALARQFVQAGADAVIGHHTHTAQGVEAGKNTVICYSLGNFLFGSANPFQANNLILLMDFESKKPGVRAARLVPLRGDYRLAGHAPRTLEPSQVQAYWPELYQQSARISPSIAGRLNVDGDSIVVDVTGR